jgi:phosphonate transport system substrate-binding protein
MTTRCSSTLALLVLLSMLGAFPAGCVGPADDAGTASGAPLPRGGADETIPTPGECNLGSLRVGLVSPGPVDQQALCMAPLEAYLGALLGARVEVVLYEDYDALVSDVVRGDLDVAQLPPLAFVLARERDPALVLLATQVSLGDVRYSGYVVVRRDSEARTLRDLASKRLAITSYSSASGFLFALARLIQEEIDVKRLLTRAVLAGSHLKAIEAVVDGRADAAATYRGGLEAARDAGIDTRALRVLGITSPIPQEALVAHSHLPSRHVACLRRAFLVTNKATAPGRGALARFPKFDGWTATNEDFYAIVREQLRIVRAAAPEVAP